MAPAYYTSGTSDEDTPPSSDATTPPRSSTPSTSEHSEDDQSQGEEESSDMTSNATTNERESTDNYEEELKDFWTSIKKAKELWSNFVLVWGEDSLGPEIAEFSRDVLMNLAEDESQIPDSLYVMPVALYHPISLTHSDASHSLRQEGTSIRCLLAQERMNSILNELQVPAGGDAPNTNEEEGEGEGESNGQQGGRTE